MTVTAVVNLNIVTGHTNTKAKTAFVLVVFIFFGTHSAVLVQFELVVFMIRIGHVYC